MRIATLLFLFVASGELFSFQQDSLEYYARKSDYAKLRYLTETKLYSQGRADQRLLFYYASSYQLDNSKLALAKVDSVLDLDIFRESTIWKERLQAQRISSLRKNGRYQQAVDEAKKLNSEFSDSIAIFDVSHIVSVCFRKMNQYDSALRWALRLQKSAELMRDDLRLHRALQNRANLYDALKQREQTIEIERQLLAIADRLENSDLQVLDRCNLGSSFVNLGNYDSARFYFQRALVLAGENENIKRLPLIYYNIGSLEYRLDRYEEAVQLLKSCLDYASETGDPTTTSSAHYLTALCYLEMGDLNKVQKQIDLGLKLASQHDLLQDRLHFLELQSHIQNEKGDYIETIQTLQDIRVLEDSILNKERMETIEELEAKHETEKKEQQIEDLEKEAIIANLKISQQNIQLLGALSILLIGAIAGFSIYRNGNLKTEQQRLMVEQKLLRSQMNPHFLFNALSSVHGYIYEGDKKQAAEYLSMFSELTRDILNHSSQELIQLSKELITLEKYVNLQRVRFSGITYTVEIEEGIEPAEICLPPMILQPFVENSIEHGLKGQERGCIVVRVKKEGDEILCQIEDDGVGLGDEENKNHQSKAIEIARERISLLPGMKKRKDVLTVQNQEKGVLVELRLPLLEWV